MQALARATKEVVRAAGARGFASSVPERKVAVLGAAGEWLARLLQMESWQEWWPG